MSAPDHFYDNPAIASIASSPRWTVSDIDKMPLDIRALQRGETREDGSLKGAVEKNATYLMSLHELRAFLPNAANNAFALHSELDRLMVLDIEKTCEPERARHLLQIPALYRELSMSGKGYHLVLPIPKAAKDYPEIMARTAMVGPEKQYEVLIDHWVTFTRKPIPAHLLPEPAGPALWEEVFTVMAKKTLETPPPAEFTVMLERPTILGYEKALAWMTRQPLPKTVDDFRGDHSRFEFSSLGTLYGRLSPIIAALEEQHGVIYEDYEKAWLIYDAITLLIAPRHKHSEVRSGAPLLLNSASALVAERRRAAEQS